jgi:single-strand DNA-binding protein
MAPSGRLGQAGIAVRTVSRKRKNVAIEGKLVHRAYENKESEKRYVTEVHCDELLLL